jgi:chaperonin GroES
MSNIKPLNGIIVLKKLEEEEQTYGQIVIPDMGKEKPEMGIVVEVSDTYNWHRGDYYESKVKVGDKVVIPKMGSMTISQDGEDYILIKETEILAVIENN